jgi:hypothetical protein
MKYLGIILLVMALVVALVPQFTTCESHCKFITMASGMTTPMICSWTARAELLTSVPLFVIGAMMIFSRRRESRLILSVLGTILGIGVILLPTSLIGVCSSTMLCNTVMKPTLLSAGELITGISLVSLLVSIGLKRTTDELSKVSVKNIS